MVTHCHPLKMPYSGRARRRGPARSGFGLLLAALLLSVAAAPASGNALAGHPSPYLAMHAQDPVQWQDWSPEAVARARREGKLLFVSIGYFSCHWCHVMQRESYRDETIAAVLNEHFVPVKVDRELHPALDAYLMEFVRAMVGAGGWPLNVFLTPEGYPLVGTVYLPPERFLGLLERVAGQWDARRDELRNMAASAAAILAERRATPVTTALGTEAPGRVVAAFLRETQALADPVDGGFGRGRKFPSAPQLALLLAIERRSPQPARAEFLALTLDRMASRGIRDQLGGGFFRYSTDAAWHLPHFEKMLYDNALLAEIYLDAADVLDARRFETVARDTLDFMLREMGDPSGGLIASLSAVDASGLEGGPYLVEPDAVQRILTPAERAVAEAAWGLGERPPLPGGFFPVRGADPAEVAEVLGIAVDDAHARLESARAKLLEARARRKPLRDQKVLAGWNGLALSALVRAASLENGARYLEAARAMRDCILGTLWDGERLARAATGEGAYGRATLEDYAYAAQGLLRWAEATRDEEDLAQVHAMIAQGWARFRTPEGWRLSEETLIPGRWTEAVIADDALPSPSATLVATTLALAERTGDEAMRHRAEAALGVAAPGLEASPFFYATQIRLLQARRTGVAD